jgi:general secretion pathway protein G
MKRSYGFTLIELLIVVAIIGILAAIAVPNFINAQTRAKIARNHSDMQALGTALAQYQLDNNHYPPVTNCAGPADRHGERWALRVLTSPMSYIASLPSDPFNPGDKESGNVSGRHDYGLYWYMDRLSRGTFGSCTPASASRFFKNDAQKWSLKGPGPNKIEDINTMVTGLGQVILVYDLSNGLISAGDVYRWGP